MSTIPHPLATTDRRILESAQRLMQDRGYNAFSYADISSEVGVRNATIHYHFPSKGDLARSVVARYRGDTQAMMARIDKVALDAADKLTRYVDLYATIVHGGPGVCLCALLAAEFHTLPESVRAEVRAFYGDHEQWLTQVLDAGRAAGTLQVGAPVAMSAQALLAGLEGAMLAARAHDDATRFDTIAHHLLRPFTDV